MPPKKPNAMLARIEAKYRERERLVRLFTLQQAEDIMVVTINEVFGAGSKRVGRFLDTYHKIFLEYAEMVDEDFESDRHIEYSKEKVDARLKEIQKDRFVPREERYWMFSVKER